jgi:hypothetical protein
MKKLICAVFVAAMLICPIAVFAMAADGPEVSGGPEVSLSVIGEKACVGETAEIAVELNAPDASVIGIYISEYDTDLLKWTGGKWEELDGMLLDNIQLANNQASCVISPAADISGKVMTLTFDVKEGIEPQTTTIDITVIVKSNGEMVTIDTSVEVVIEPGYILGDVTQDGEITNADVLQIFRYIYSNELYPLPVFEAADVNFDGDVTNADVLVIFRYIYSPELYPIVKK